MFKNIVNLITFYLCVVSVGIAQVGIETKKIESGTTIKVPPKNNEDIIKSKKPTQEENKKDKNNQITNTESKENAAENGDFNLYKKPSLVGRDSLGKGLNGPQLVKISEEIKIDCVWVKSRDYYSIWDSRNINPYQWNTEKLRDTIHLTLYEPEKGELWASPLEKTLTTSPFGPRWGSFHAGIDLNLRTGDPVYSLFDGIVRISAFMAGYGNTVVVRHKNGLETLYGHLSKCKVEVGQEVKSGQIIGLGGSTGWSTGPHLHLETRYAGQAFNPALLYDFGKDDQLMFQEFDLMPHHFAHILGQVRQKITHTVLAGETLQSISIKYNVPVYNIARKNQLTIFANLKEGQKLIIF
ncbi:MAG: LysM peptidoglycan-binding domain-containing protein [Cytophagales bacterium]|nr:MAG: LysM peptidoglycan-binding domain-containing protein [Cytophagales bacterium]TAH29159.1 MAG: LysM peptidoglycan-binding domain-containing protein [Cytophagales bacterium]